MSDNCPASALLVLCICSGVIGVAYLGFDPLVRSLVLRKLVLSNTSETFHIWEDPPISPHFKVSEGFSKYLPNTSYYVSDLFFQSYKPRGCV